MLSGIDPRERRPGCRPDAGLPVRVSRASATSSSAAWSLALRTPRRRGAGRAGRWPPCSTEAAPGGSRPHHETRAWPATFGRRRLRYEVVEGPGSPDTPNSNASGRCSVTSASRSRCSTRPPPTSARVLCRVFRASPADRHRIRAGARPHAPRVSPPIPDPHRPDQPAGRPRPGLRRAHRRPEPRCDDRRPHPRHVRPRGPGAAGGPASPTARRRGPRPVAIRDLRAEDAWAFLDRERSPSRQPMPTWWRTSPDGSSSARGSWEGGTPRSEVPGRPRNWPAAARPASRTGTPTPRACSPIRADRRASGSRGWSASSARAGRDESFRAERRGWTMTARFAALGIAALLLAGAVAQRRNDPAGYGHDQCQGHAPAYRNPRLRRAGGPRAGHAGRGPHHYLPGRAIHLCGAEAGEPRRHLHPGSARWSASAPRQRGR